jgi:hypothetical protein
MLLNHVSVSSYDQVVASGGRDTSAGQRTLIGADRAGIIAVDTPAAAVELTIKGNTDAQKARNAHIVAFTYLSAGAFSASVAYCQFHLPFEVGDNLGNLLQLGDTTVVRIFLGTLHLQGFLRPMTWATMKIVFDMSGGHYFVAFRILHVLSASVLIMAFARLTRADSWSTLCVALISMTTLIGMPAFHDVMNETELNTKLTLGAVCLVVVNVSASRGHVWKDALMLLLVAYSLLTNELGLLVWVCVAGAYIVGFRGISRQAVLAATALLVAYFYVRFQQLHVGTPALNERSSGMGFTIRSTNELVELFGSNPLPFYAYNIASSVMTVLFSEPRAGVFVFVRDLFGYKLQSGTVLNVTTSALTTGVMAWFVSRRWRRWIQGDLEYEDRLFLVSVAVVLANALISFPYLKDVILNIASAFYGLATCMALRVLVSDLPRARFSADRAAAVCLLVAAISIGWSLRALSFYADMRVRAFKAQTDWVFVDDWLREQRVTVTPQQRVLVDRLRMQMIGMRVPKVYLDPPWMRNLLTPD